MKLPVGERIDSKLLIGLFEADEGSINLYYGRIGGGKTYAATADILSSLKKGRVVYADWRINYPGYDERTSFGRNLFNFFFFWRKIYFYFPHQNFHYFEKTDEWAQTQNFPTFIEWFVSRTDCDIYVDEVHELMDSYESTRFSLKKRMAILRTRHVNRTLNLITQRPTALHVSARANVNRFFKCERLLSWPFILFRRTEFQDMSDESVDENADPISRRLYIGSKEVFNAYNSKYLRGGIEVSQQVYFEAYRYNVLGKLKMLVMSVLPQRRAIKGPDVAARKVIIKEIK